MGKIKEYIAWAAAGIHRKRTLLIYTWFALAILDSAAVRIVGIICGGVLIASWVLARVGHKI